MCVRILLIVDMHFYIYIRLLVSRAVKLAEKLHSNFLLKY